MVAGAGDGRPAGASGRGLRRLGDHLAVAWLTIRWIGAHRVREQFAIGAAWVALIVAFEVSLGLALGYSRERMLSDYDVANGGWMGFGLLFLLCAPWLAAKARGLR